MSSGPANGNQDVTIDYKEVTESYTLRRVKIQPGGVVAPYRTDTGYLVFTVAPARVRRTTYLNGKIEKVEELALDPEKPFYVPGFPPGVEISIENIGESVAVFGKRSIKPPNYDF